MTHLLAASGVLLIVGLAALRLIRFPLLGFVVRASVRMGIQLALVGAVLGAVFRWQHNLVTLAYLLLMTIAATYIVVERQPVRYPALYAQAGTALGIAVWSTTATALYLAEGAASLLDPQQVIPLFGLCCGNMLSGFTIGFREFLSLQEEGRRGFESRLCLGATTWEAAWPYLSQACEKALLPITNAMLAAGLVSLPGALVGQIAAGREPLAAACYQILVLATIFAATSLGVLLVLFFSYRRLAQEYQL